MGTQTDQYLSSIFADSFKREVDADEAVWRSMPFFAALIGLALAVLPAVYRSIDGAEGRVARIVAYSLFGLALISFFIAAGWFARVIWIRRYRYPPTDLEILRYAEALERYHRDLGEAPSDVDENTLRAVRLIVLSELAHASSVNRRNNHAKTSARSQVLLFAMTGFLLAFLCEATILGSLLF